MLTLTVLGCDGSHPGPGGGSESSARGAGAGAASGYLLRWWPTATSVWIDAGPGTFAGLQRYTEPRRLDAVVLSHRHHDHCSDLAGFVTAARWLWRWDRAPLPVYAADGVREQLGPLDDDGILDWHLVRDADTAAVGPLRLDFVATDHGPPTVAVRAAVDGRALGYSADTGPSWPLSALGSHLDLVLCEATYTEQDEGTGLHMSGRQAGAAARAAGARRLVVTHRWAHVAEAAVVAEAAAHFGAPVTAAAVGRGFSL